MPSICIEQPSIILNIFILYILPLYKLYFTIYVINLQYASTLHVQCMSVQIVIAQCVHIRVNVLLLLLECVWMCLNVFECTWMCLDVLEYVWICLDVLECAAPAANYRHFLGLNLCLPSSLSCGGPPSPTEERGNQNQIQAFPSF